MQEPSATFAAKERGMFKEDSTLSLLKSPRADLDLNKVEILAKIQKATQDANELMRQNYLRDIWSF